jgi:lysine/ornithine N-monooxygenase
VISILNILKNFGLIAHLRDAYKKSRNQPELAAKIIVHPGQNGFEKAGGIVKHSSAYRDITDEELKGKHVIIVGGSKSATYIAIHVANHDVHQVTTLYIGMYGVSPTM